jgi:hypothetical protein
LLGAGGTRARAALVLIVGLVVTLPVAVISSASHAPNWPHFPEFSDPYTQRNDGNCLNNPIDPINIVFEGQYASAGYVARHIQDHAEWFGTSGSTQNLNVKTGGPNYDCRLQGYQRTDSGDFAQFHTRLWLIPATVGTPGPLKTVGDAHHEDLLDCGHAVDENGSSGSGFDQGRRELRQQFEGEGHAAHNENWGNTRNFAQCDANHPGASDTCQDGPATGDFCDGWAGSNGNGVLIRVGHVPHSL